MVVHTHNLFQAWHYLQPMQKGDQKVKQLLINHSAPEEWIG